MKSLVVYYSRSGNTELAARKISEELGSDIEEIRDKKRRGGVFGYAGAVINPKGPTTIEEIEKRPGDYDLVIIGTPIWWYTCTPAVTAYLKQYGNEIKKAVFFYTCNVDNKIKALDDMEAHLGTAPVRSVGFVKPKKNADMMEKKVKRFVKELKSKYQL